ncbi:fibronectin type III domain-containing protein [Dactylosporangium sp. CA-139066]|uniref:fibronectin type III domain-containing protein n=1 Tax=Dactylosporangium sp. CA-139066 TaxID=3239930 RepID=UPI003D8C7F3A
MARFFHVREGDRVVARTSTTSTQLEVPFSTSHTYTVTAVDGLGRESAPSTPVTGRSWLSGYNPECMPSSVPLTVTAVSATALTVAWSPHPLGGDLELRVDGQSLGFTPLTGARVGGLAPATTHQLALYRYNRCGSGALTQVASASATTAAGAPVTLSAPSGLTVTTPTDTAVGLSWAPPAGAPPARYAVYDAGTLVAVTTGTAVRVDRLYPATAHRFTVAGLDAAGNESTHSAPAGAATQPCLAVPAQPTSKTRDQK